ncbi:PAS domain S-box protein [Stappia sediminis]|uniref:PAS domain S-box protein n=1 Tax=Stappia sediminis TaxID=2692190 RepID=UPI00136BD71C|nr:PAS domain S-box protein [Stappia sediminis]
MTSPNGPTRPPIARHVGLFLLLVLAHCALVLLLRAALDPGFDISRGGARAGVLSLFAGVAIYAVPAAVLSYFAILLAGGRDRRQAQGSQLDLLRDPDIPRRRSEDREARLQAILDWMGEGLVTFDEDGVIEFVNPAIEKMFKQSAAELVGGNISSLVPPDKRDLLKVLAAKPPVSGSAISLKADGRRQDGEDFPLDISLTEYKFGGRRLFAGLLRDISERKATEAKLREVERQLREAIEFLPDAFVLFDESDRLIVCNDRYRELYATSADLMRPGMRFDEIIREGVRRGQYVDANDDPEGWIERRLEMHRRPPLEPIEQHLDDGRWLRVYERRTPDGRTVGFRIDITELKHRQEALERSEARARAMVTSALDAIAILDEDCNVVDFNPAAERITGYRRAEIVGRSIVDVLVPERHREDALRRFRAILQKEPGEEPGQRVHAKAARKDGSEFLCELAMNVATGPNGKLLIGFARDVTEERAKTLALKEAKARAEDANLAKANFLAMMSHEIRTPLNAVTGILDLLKESPLTPVQQQYVRAAANSADALLNILNDILDLSRVEANRLEFQEKPFFLRPLVFGVRDLFAVPAQNKGLKLAVHIESALPVRLAGDVGRIRQVLINLVGNAIKFTPDGVVEIRVTGKPEGESGLRIRFEVSDTGPGIPHDMRDSVFQKFTTLETASTDVRDGVGLGLTICRELVDGMGGRISLDSEEGRGSCFAFELDLAPAPETEADDAGDEAETLAQTLIGARVLLAEDNDTNRMITVDLLKRWGCEVEAVRDGAEAIERLDRESYDVILMDVSMPVLDGVSATAEIRARGDDASKIPIIALTAHAFAEERDRVLQAGMSDFLTKPVDPAELGRHLAQALSTSRTRMRERPMTLPLVDTSVLQGVIDNLSDSARIRVLEQCESDLMARAEDLRNAGDDLDCVERASHVLSSLAGTFGASALFSLSDTVNRAVLDEDRKALEKVPELVLLIERTVAALRQAVDECREASGHRAQNEDASEKARRRRVAAAH